MPIELSFFFFVGEHTQILPLKDYEYVHLSTNLILKKIGILFLSTYSETICQYIYTYLTDVEIRIENEKNRNDYD